MLNSLILQLRLIKEISQKLDVDMSIKLWDGRVLPLGPNVTSDLKLIIAHPGVIASLLKRAKA